MSPYDEFITAWLEAARTYHTKAGRQFNLTVVEFDQVITPHQRRTIKKRINDGTITGFMAHRKWAYVLSWTSKEAYLAGVMDKTTAKVMTRDASERMNYLQKGDKHSEAARAKISKSLTGYVQTEAHKQARSDAQKGKKRGPMSEEHKAKLRAAAFAREAAKRAAANSTQ